MLNTIDNQSANKLHNQFAIQGMHITLANCDRIITMASELFWQTSTYANKQIILGNRFYSIDIFAKKMEKVVLVFATKGSDYFNVCRLNYTVCEK